MTLAHLAALLICIPLSIVALGRLLGRAPGFAAGVKTSLAIAVCVLLAHCAYSIGTRERQIPGGYRLVSVPVFKNSTAEVGVEVYFTDAMIRELERSKLAKVVDKRGAELVLIGTVESVRYITTNSQLIGPTSTPAQIITCPDGRTRDPKVGCNPYDKGGVQNTEYRILVTTDLKLQRISDERILWQGKFSGERTYLTPVVSILGLNSADALYNQSAREQNIKSMSTDIMIEAYERMTENF